MQREALGPTLSQRRPVPFVGREAELDLLAARFDEGARLVTLLGPGGIGKTTLAVERATRRVAAGDRTSIVFCDLASAGDAAGIADAMALACGADGVASVAGALAARGEVVVVIDNVDGMADVAAELVGRWMDGAGEAELVVTSRERLGLVGEVVVEVGPLGAGAGAGPGAWAGGIGEGDPGVALLVAAARRGASGFLLRAEDVACAAEIVAILEGVPLAIEMAGARLPLLGARALLEHVRTAADELRRDERGGPARHASLDAAVRGSFLALEAHERDVLAQLTVFRGGFTVESAAAVVAAPSAIDVIAVIEGLRSRSLLRTRDAGAARFDLYRAVRSFVEREHPAPIAGAAERRDTYFVAAAERAAERAHADVAARAWLAAERDNVLAIAARVLDAGVVTSRTAEPALRGIVALCPLLLARGSLASVAALIAPVVDRTRDSGADARLSARATLLRGVIRREGGDVRAALKDLLVAESIARALGDELLGADVRIELGRTLRLAGELAAARSHFERAAGAFASIGARAREAHALAWLAVSSVSQRSDAGAGAMVDEGTSARALLERAVALAAGDPASRGPYLVLLGRACAETGDRAAAKRALDEALAAAQLDRDARTDAEARMLMGLVLHDGGDLARAAELLSSARDVFAVHGLDVDAAIARGHLGVLAREEGRAAEAYALLADARDLAVQAGRVDAAAYFGAHLALIAGPAGGSGEVGQAGGVSRATARDLVGAWEIGEIGGADGVVGLPAATDGAVGLHARIARRVANTSETTPALPDDALVVGAEGAWFRAPHGARVGLERESLALLLDHLAGRERAGATLGSLALFAAAWPGEKAIASAAAHRVRVAVATLRKMGLRDAIVTLPDGYALAAELRVVRA